MTLRFVILLRAANSSQRMAADRRVVASADFDFPSARPVLSLLGGIGANDRCSLAGAACGRAGD